MTRRDPLPPPPPDRYLAPDGNGGLLWGGLVEGTLIRRYKRFLADVELAGGGQITAHTANTGAMLGCSEPGRRVWLSRHDSATRKYPHTWEMIEMPTSIVGVNTAVPNRLVKAAIAAGRIPELPADATIKSEFSYGESRLDLVLSPRSGPDIFVEIKNCSLVEDGVAYFPDAVTVRGAKHVRELAGIAQSGRRAVVFILVQRTDAARFSPADHIDPGWGKALREALRLGVELVVYEARLDTTGIAVARTLPLAFGD